MLEETGCRAQTWRRIGTVHPNPAFLDNRCDTFLATGVEQVGEIRPDEGEHIRLIWLAEQEVSRLMKTGQITHALVIAAFHWYWNR